MTNDRPEWKRGFYRSRRGVVFGVCRGIADQFDVSVFWLRLIVIVCVIFSGFFPVIFGYIIAALLMKPEPAVPFATESDREFYDSYVSSPSLGVHRLKRTYDALNRRVQRMESIVTSRDYNWKPRMGD